VNSANTVVGEEQKIADDLSNDDHVMHIQGNRRIRVLLLSQWFDPEPTFKGLEFAKALTRHGLQVAVLTGFPNYPHGSLYPGYPLRPWRRDNYGGVQVLRVPLCPSRSRSRIGRVANYVSFALSASVAVALIKRPDVVYVYHPPATAALPALVLRFLRGAPFVFDIQDIWPESLSATGMVGNKRVLASVEQFMSLVYRSAERITVLSNGFRELLSVKGVTADKVDVIPNWTHEGSAPPGSPPSAINGVFRVLYAGNVGPAQGLDVVIDAAERLSDARVEFRIVGDGIDLKHIRDEAQRRGLGSVTFAGRVTPDAVTDVLASAHALLVHLKDDPLFAVTVPSKTQAYLWAGRPILMGVRGDAARMVVDAGAGILFEPESGADLARAVRELMAMSHSELVTLGENGRRYYDANLSLAAGAARFARILRDALAGTESRKEKG
jgi:glycosyltransferase involved in cell wall biosynthesis